MPRTKREKEERKKEIAELFAELDNLSIPELASLPPPRIKTLAEIQAEWAEQSRDMHVRRGTTEWYHNTPSVPSQITEPLPPITDEEFMSRPEPSTRGKKPTTERASRNQTTHMTGELCDMHLADPKFQDTPEELEKQPETPTPKPKFLHDAETDIVETFAAARHWKRLSAAEIKQRMEGNVEDLFGHNKLVPAMLLMKGVPLKQAKKATIGTAVELLNKKSFN